MAFHTATGSENHVHYGDNSAWEGNAAMSWAFHINPDTLTNNERILAKGTGNINTSPWQIQYYNTGVVRLRVADGAASTIVDSTTTLTAGQDNTVVIVWNGTTVRFIINGTDDGTSALVEAMTTDAGNLTLCGLTGVSASMDGVLEHVFIWDTDLSLTEALSYHNGVIPDPSNLVFWQPCWSSSMPDLIQGAAATVTGTVGVEDGFTEKVPRYPSQSGFFGYLGVTPLLKVIDEDENIGEGVSNLLGLLRVIDETENVGEDNANLLGILKFIDETLELQDGDNHDVWDPDGKLTETMSDGTVWTTIFPPFIRRTQWTDNG